MWLTSQGVAAFSSTSSSNHTNGLACPGLHLMGGGPPTLIQSCAGLAAPTMTCRGWPLSPTSPVVDGTFIKTASQINGNAPYLPSPSRLRLLSARNRGLVGAPTARTNDLDGGENVGDQLDLPAGGCEDGAVAITEGDRTPRAAAPSFRAERRFCMLTCTFGNRRAMTAYLLFCAVGGLA